MKTPWIKSLALLGFLTMQSHAIFGIGGHWTPAPGLEVKASKGVISTSTGIPSRTLTLDEQGVSGAQGFGGKLWIDFLPLIDLELTGNVQFGYYDVGVTSSQNTGTTTPINFDLGTLGVEGKPFFARSYADVAVLYPFLKFPPVINLIKLYGGGGLTFGAATPIVSPAFAKTALAKANYNPDNDDANNSQASKIIVSAIENADFEKGMGMFLQLGAHAKLPIIPIAAYADMKYRFVSFNPALVDGNGLNFELGAALAF